MIDRRDLIARLGGTIFVWPPQVRGQEPGRTYRVGGLSGLPHDAPTHVALYDAEPARFCRESNRQIDGQGFGLPHQFAQHTAELVNAKVEKRLFLCIRYRHNTGMKYGYARVSPGGKSESVTDPDSPD
jgi:hypothetical protein